MLLFLCQHKKRVPKNNEINSLCEKTLVSTKESVWPQNKDYVGVC